MNRKQVSWLVDPGSPDTYVLVLQSWRLWLLGGLIGGLVTWIVYSLFPPLYRAQATVIVDNNLEEAWPYVDDRALFHFLDRETRKLQQIAWADVTLEQVVTQIEEVSISELRAGKLILSQPSDGGWHFLAQDHDPLQAKLIASVWAQAFVDQVEAAIEMSPELEAARLKLVTEIIQQSETNPLAIPRFTSELYKITNKVKGISAYVDLSISQSEQLPVQRITQTGVSIFIGSLLGAVLALIFVVFTINVVRSE